MPLNAMLGRVLAALLAAMIGLAVLPAAAEEDEPDTSSLAPAAATQPGVAELEALRSATEGDTSLPEDARKKVVELLTRAIDERRAQPRVPRRRRRTCKAVSARRRRASPSSWCRPSGPCHRSMPRTGPTWI